MKGIQNNTSINKNKSSMFEPLIEEKGVSEQSVNNNNELSDSKENLKTD